LRKTSFLQVFITSYQSILVHLLLKGVEEIKIGIFRVTILRSSI